MISRPSALRDFTVDRRVWLLTGVALIIGTGAAALSSDSCCGPSRWRPISSTTIV